MPTALPYDTPLSHPPTDDADGMPLVDHSNEVEERAVTLITRGPSNARLREVCAVAARCHDFGKLTPFFQKKLDGTLPTRPSTANHAPLGALATYHVLRGCGYNESTALAGFVAVARHHGSLPNVAEYVTDTALSKSGATSRINILETQIESINKNDRLQQVADEILDTSTWEEFSAAFEARNDITELTDYLTTDGLVPSPDDTAPGETFYDDCIQVWSALVCADKTSAANLPEHTLDCTCHHPKAITEYINTELGDADTGTKEDYLNTLRNDARKEAVSNAKNMSPGGTANLTLPTGLGKTLTGLQAALTLQNSYDNPGRVIYALPFTSVIDQTHDIATEVFNADLMDDSLTVHHYLETTATSIGETTSQSRDASRREYLLGETWNSGLVLTTYVQLFESLVTPQNKQSLKLPALYNSVIVLDEPQSLPERWWNVVRRVKRTLVEEYNATIISMTATPPKLFADETPLIENERHYFRESERVEYEVDDTIRAYLRDPTSASISHSTAATRVLDSLGETSSALAICNTIESAQKLTEEVNAASKSRGQTPISIGDVYAELLDEKEDVPSVDALTSAIRAKCDAADNPLITLHLSTHHRPKDRRVFIDASRTLAEQHVAPFCTISTQLVEAGVDVSFECVYRDLAPLSSIVQAAGRCNRSFERDSGIVTIWRLAAPTGNRTPARLVYGQEDNNRLAPTANVLANVIDEDATNRVRETRLTVDGITEYYDQLNQRGLPTEYVELIENARFADLHDLQYIASNPNAVDVLVCRTEKDRELVQQIQNAMQKGKYKIASDYLKQAGDLRVTISGLGTSLPTIQSDSDDPTYILDTTNTSLFESAIGVSNL